MYTRARRAYTGGHARTCTPSPPAPPPPPGAHAHGGAAADTQGHLWPLHAHACAKPLVALCLLRGLRAGGPLVPHPPEGAERSLGLGARGGSRPFAWYFWNYQEMWARGAVEVMGGPGGRWGQQGAIGTVGTEGGSSSSPWGAEAEASFCRTEQILVRFGKSSHKSAPPEPPLREQPVLDLEPSSSRGRVGTSMAAGWGGEDQTPPRAGKGPCAPIEAPPSRGVSTGEGPPE